MERGYSNKLVGQTGEYLVAAELSRRGLIATTFTGNVPHYDIIASDETGRHVSVQVKTSRSSSWQFGDLRKFCDIEFNGNRQIVRNKKECPVLRLVVVFVRIGENRDDAFYILTWQKLCDLVVSMHKDYLKKHGGVRPKKWDSLHSAIGEKDLLRYRDKWDTIARSLK